MQHTLISSNRKARRLIYQAMAGAALGVGLLVLPALAANPTVNTVNDVVDPNDGLTSLREAINAVNADSGSSVIQFDPGLGIDPAFTLDSALPSITNANAIDIDTSAVGSITLPQPLVVEGGNVTLAAASQLYANVTADAQSTFTLLSGDGESGVNGTDSNLITGGGGFGSSAGDGADGVAGGDVNLTDDVTATESTFNIFGGVAGDGADGGLGVPGGSNDTGGKGGSGGDGGFASVTGNVISNDSTVLLGAGFGGSGGNGADGQTAAPGGTGGKGGFGGDGGYGGDAGITGKVTATDSTIEVLAGDAGAGGNGGDGDASDPAGGTGGDAGIGGDGGFATINGAVDAVNSSVGLIGGNGGDGGNDGSGGAGGHGGDGGFGGVAGISGDHINASKSTFVLYGGYGGAGGDGGLGGAGGDANIIGDVTANESTFEIFAGDGGGGYNLDLGGNGGNASITGNVIANESTFTLFSGSDGYGFNPGFGGDSFIDGSFTGNGNSELDLYGEDGFAYVTKDVTLNDTSTLSYSGTPILNFNGGTYTTTLGPDATLVAPLDFTNPGTDYLTVNNLALNNSRLQPSWDTSESTFTVGQTFHILDYLGNRTGEFGAVQSPLTFDIDYGSGSNDGITLSLTGMNFTRASGNANQGALEGYLNNFVNTAGGVISLNQADLPFNLADLTQQISQNGPGALDQYIPDNLAAQNAETYSSQQAFVSSILDNLRNANYQTGGSSFDFNQSLNINQTGAQLISLRRAMNTPFAILKANGDGALPSGGVWAAYSGSRSRIDADQGLGSRQWSQASDGYTVGYTGGGDGLRWGAVVGHQKSTLSFADLSATGNTEGYNAGLYAAWTRKSTYLNALLGYGNYDNDATSALGSLYFKSKALSGALELGHHLGKTGSGFTPYAQLQWTHLKNENATDTGSGLTLQGGSHNIYSTALGVRYNHQMKDGDDSLKGGWETGLAWLHQFGDTDFSSNASYSAAVPGSFSVQTTPLDGNALQMRLGAYGRIHGNLIGFAGYQGTFGSSQKINAVNAGVGYQF